MTPERYLELESRVAALAQGIEEVVGESGLAIQVPRVGTILGIFFHSEAVKNYDDARAAGANGHYALFFNEMLQRGISLAPSSYEVVFTSLAHTDAEITRTIDAAGESAVAVLEALGR